MVQSAVSRICWRGDGAAGDLRYLQRAREESVAVILDPFTMTMYKGKRRHHR
ncbi:RNA-binding Raly-like protein isoform X2, partial [Tachysurus ichikawai]